VERIKFELERHAIRKGISISRDEQYVVERTQFEEYNGKAKTYLNYDANPIGENIELNIPLQ